MLWFILSEWYTVLRAHAFPWLPIYCQVKVLVIIFNPYKALGSAVLKTVSLFYILTQHLILVMAVSGKWEKEVKDAV